MDLFSRQRSFFMKGQPIFYTAYGGFLSIAVALFAILFFLYMATSWITEEDRTINKFQIFNDDTLDWSTSAKIMIGLPNSTKEKVVLYRDFGVYQESPFFHECLSEEYTSFYNNKPANLSLSYFCGDLIFPGLYDHSLILAICFDEQVLTPGLNCTHDPDFKKTYFEYMILTHRYNTFANPFKITKLLTPNFNVNEGNVQTIYLSYNKLIEYDRFQRIKEITYFTDLVNMDQPLSNDGVIFQLKIVKDSEDYSNLSNLQIEVQGQKIPSLLAMTLVIVNIFFRCSFYLNNIISDFLFRKYVLSLFKDDLDLWVKISAINEIQKNKTVGAKLSNENFIINIFSFKNDFLFHLGVGLDVETQKILKILNNEITKKLSIETIQEKKFLFHQEDIHSNGVMVKISHFLKSCDFMAPGFSFVIKKKEKFKTTLGIILTLLYWALLIVFFFSLGKDFVFKTNPHIYQIQSEEYNNKYDFDYDIPVMLYFPKEITPFHNITYFNRSNITPGLTNFTQCTLNEMDMFKKNADPKFSYWCSNVKYYFTLKPDLWEDVYISLMECSDLINSGFTNTGCVVNNFTSNNFFNITIGTTFISKSIDISALDLGIKNVIYDRNYTLPDMSSNTFEYDFQFTRQDVNDDSDFFFDTHEITSYSTFYNSSVFYFGSDLDNVADFYFRFQIHLVWSRIYGKFSETLAEITAVAHLFWIIFYFVNLFFEDYFFINLFKKEFINKYFEAEKTDIEVQKNLNDFLPNQGGGIAGKVARGEAVKNKIFTLRNYIIYKIFGKFFWYHFFLVYETIYQEMIMCASLEGILKKKLKKSKVSKIGHFLACFDFIGENRLIYYNSSNKYTTRLGGILSIASFSLIFIFIIIFGSNFWYQMNPKITSYPARFYEMDPDDYKMNIPIIMDYSLNASDYLFFFNLNSIENEYEVDFAMRNCSLNDSAFFNISFDSDKRYGCSNVNQVLLFNYSNLGNVDGNFLLTDCEHSETCGIDPSTAHYSMPNDRDMSIGYLFPISVFNQNDPYHPITQEWKHFKNTSTTHYLPKAEYDILNNQLYDDHGWIFPDAKKNDFTSIINVNLKPDRASRMFICFTYVAQNVRIMKRTYQKFPELLANIFAMLNLINQLIFAFYNLYNRYRFHKYLYENTKPINNQSKIKLQLPFYKFLAGMFLGLVLKRKNYKKMEELYKNVFALENILSSEISERSGSLAGKFSVAESHRLTIGKQDTLSNFCKTVNNYEMTVGMTKEENFEEKEKPEDNKIIICTYTKNKETETERNDSICKNESILTENKKE